MHTLLVLGLLMFGQAQPATIKPVPAPVPYKQVEDLIYLVDLLHDRCESDPNAQRACKLMDVFGKEVEARGWCYGHDGQIEADKHWEPCKNAELYQK